MAATKNVHLQSSGCQTEEIASRSGGLQYPETEHVGCQTDAKRGDSGRKAEADLLARLDWRRVTEFVHRAVDITLQEIEESAYELDLDFSVFFPRHGNSEAVLRHVIKPTEKTSTDSTESGGATAAERLDLLDVAWNCSSSSIAIAFGHQSHETDFCTHTDGYISLFSRFNLLRPDQADQQKESVRIDTVVGGCVSALGPHPGIPAVYATGSYTGSVSVYDLRQMEETAEKDPLVASTATYSAGSIQRNMHQDRVTALAWVGMTKKNQYGYLVTSGQDGRVIMWRLADMPVENAKPNPPQRRKFLDPIRNFIITIQDLPRLAPGTGRGAGPTTEVGIKTMDMNPLVRSQFAVGTVGGGIFLCSLESEAPPNLPLDYVPMGVGGSGVGAGHFLSPITLTHGRHKGPVDQIAFSATHKNIFFSLCNSDSELRLYRTLEREPLRIFTLSGILDSGHHVTRAFWSPVTEGKIFTLYGNGALYSQEVKFSSITSSGRDDEQQEKVIDSEPGETIAGSFSLRTLATAAGAGAGSGNGTSVVSESEDDLLLAIGTGNGTVKLWHVPA